VDLLSWIRGGGDVDEWSDALKVREYPARAARRVA
jgi:hypothetical protein